MKKHVLSLIILLSIVTLSTPAFAENEVVDDYLDIAASYVVSGNYASAIDYLNKILTIESGNKDIISLKNMLVQMQNGKITSPIVSSNQKLIQAQAAKKAGNKPVEMQLVTSAAADNTYQSNMLAGDFYRNAKQYAKAIPYYEKAANSSTKSSAPLLYLGICYFEMKNYNEAYPLLTKFIAYNQQESYGYAMRARVLAEMKRYNDAETDIVTAIALEDSIEYKYLEGLILFNRGNYKKAQTTLEKIAPKIQTSDVYKFLGMSYYFNGDLNNALINLDKAILLADNDRELINQYNLIKAKVTSGTN